MALRAVPEHPKFFALKDALHIRKYHALGILEALWHFAGKFAPRGNVGKFKDSEIEGWLEWDGERGALVAALTDVGWLDKSEEHRLVIHDWHEHADQTTRKQLGRTKTAFVSDRSGQVPDVSGQNGKVSGPPEPVPVPEPVKKKQVPSRDKREANPIHVVFKGLVEDAWKEWGNPLDMPWDGAEGKQLGMLIGANPKLGPDGMRRLLQYRARSTGVNLAERPSKWLRSLTDYARGPLNEFKQPQEMGNGTYQGKTEHTVSAAQRVIEAIENRNAAGNFGYPQAGEADRPGLPSLCE